MKDLTQCLAYCKHSENADINIVISPFFPFAFSSVILLVRASGV